MISKQNIKNNAIRTCILGVLVLLFGIEMFYYTFVQEFRQVKNNTIVDSTVIGCVLTSEYEDSDGTVSRYYDVMVNYTYNGEFYESVVHMVSSKPKIGKTLSIHITPQNPQETHGVNGGIDDFIAPIIFFCIPTLFGIFLLKKANAYRKALSTDSTVIARVCKITKEEHSNSEDSYCAYCVYVDYNYNGELYKDILWYGISDLHKSRKTLEKELQQLPEKGEVFQIYINHKKPNQILSGAPFKIEH